MNTIIVFFTSNRFKSFLWRTLMMGISGLIAIVLNNLSIFDLDPKVVALIGLMFGEISKAINNKLSKSSI